MHSLAAEHEAPSDFNAVLAPVPDPEPPEVIVTEVSPAGGATTIGTNKINTAKNVVKVL